MKYKDNFVIFIISHGRAETMTTYNILKSMGCQYPIYIVIDDTDKQIDLYKKKYENVIVFDKEEQYQKTDTIDNFHNLVSAVYARNFCIDKAKEMGVKFFSIMDDDITNICIRYIDGDKLRSHKIKNIDKVIDIYLNVLDTTNLFATGFGHSWGLFGGVKSFIKDADREISQVMFIKNAEMKKFSGTQNEDGHFSYDNIDKVITSINGAIITSPKRGENEGGNFDFYNSDFYVTNFYSIIKLPSTLKIKLDRKIKRNKHYVYPKILSDRWKK